MDGNPEKQLMPELLLQVSVQELHNISAIPPEEGVMNEARDEENNIIISDSTSKNIIPNEIKNMTSIYKVICRCGCCISYKSMHS